jgi:hypothetical protein
VQRQLEFHIHSFADGFNAAVGAGSFGELNAGLKRIAAPERGFAFEGAAMALAMLDLLTPGASRRLGEFMRGAAAEHVYMAHVGAGWALARLRRRPWGTLELDPLLRWLALDGYGFHHAYFRTARVVRRARVPYRLDAAQRTVFDQGVGRALWFVEAADPDRIAVTVSAFSRERRADLWSGVGLAAAYAGAVDDRGLRRLRELGDEFWPYLAQGAAFAAKARIHARNLVPHTDRACRVLCGVGAREAASVTESALAAAGTGGTAEDYGRWRREIRAGLAGA